MASLSLIGSRLKEIRGSLSQAVFARYLNVSQGTVGRYERDLRSPDAEYILLLKKHFNINPNWLVSGEGLRLLPNGLDDPIYKDTISEPNHQSPGSENEIKIEPDSNGIPTDQPPITELITKTIEILESKTVYSNALSANIQAFHKATTLEQKFHELQADTKAAINKMESRITVLEAENNKLREQIKNIPGDCGGMVANEG
jgi:transcriptional regulator with XRE-family HTH domain